MQALKKIDDYWVALPDSYDPAVAYPVCYFVHSLKAFSDAITKEQVMPLWNHLHEQYFDHIVIAPVGKGLKAWNNNKSKTDVDWINKNYKTDEKARVYVGYLAGAMEPAIQVAFYPWVLKPNPLFFTHSVSIGTFINGNAEISDYLKSKVSTYVTAGSKSIKENLDRIKAYKAYTEGLEKVGLNTLIEIVENADDESLLKDPTTYLHAFQQIGLEGRDIVGDVMKKIQDLPNKNLVNLISAVNDLVQLALKYSKN